MTLHPDVAIHLDEIRAAAERYGVAKLEIFGSANTPHFDPKRSDVDFLVHYPEGYTFGSFGKRLFDLEDKITTILGRSAQLVMTSALKKESFRNNAGRTRTTIYVGNEPEAASVGCQSVLPTYR
jgi:predicted nucleotidyltransferase